MPFESELDEYSRLVRSRVCVATSDAIYGLARMYQALGEPKTERLILVRSREEADDLLRQEQIEGDEATWPSRREAVIVRPVGPFEASAFDSGTGRSR